MNPGKHSILVKAVDKAGNSTVQSADFSILAIASPKLIDYPKELEVGEVFQVKGTSYPNTTVTVYLKDKNGKIEYQSIETNDSGDFALIWTKKIDPGTYSMTALVEDRRGAKSEQTVPVTILVKQKALFRIGGLVINYLGIGIIILSTLACLIAFGWFLASKLFTLRRKIRNDVSKTEIHLHKSFKALRDNVQMTVELLQNTKGVRNLTKEEAIILKNLDKNINMTEKDVEIQLENIKKALK